MMTCKACVDLLRDFLDSELDANTHSELKAHLSECGVCEEFVATYQQTPGMLDSISSRCGHCPPEQIGTP